MGSFIAVVHSLGAQVIGQTSGAQALGGADGLLVQAMPLALMGAVAYFLLVRPSQAQRAEQQKLLAALKKDDEVLTHSGILGRIVALDETIVTLEVGPNTRLRILRDRIAGLQAPKAQS